MAKNSEPLLIRPARDTLPALYMQAVKGRTLPRIRKGPESWGNPVVVMIREDHLTVLKRAAQLGRLVQSQGRKDQV